MGRRVRLAWCVCVLALAATVVSARGIATADPAPSTTPAQLVTITIPDTVGQIPAQWLGYAGPPKANVWLPAGYDPSTQYPLLIMLNGLDNNYDSYRADGMVGMLEAANFPGIVVMPEGANGWYADWFNHGQRGEPSWETYELDDVIPTILATYPIRPERQYHAIAGFSMGGLGAAYLAGRLPGFFGSAASLSGFVDTQYFAPITEPAMSAMSYLLLENTPTLGWVTNPNAVEGPPNGYYADGHNPANLAVNLKQTRVFESTGTGIPSQSGIASIATLDPAQVAALVVGSAEEGPIIYPMNVLYHHALVSAGVDVTYQVHSGGHDLPDFDNELTAMLAWDPFGPTVAGSTSWTNDTVATNGQLWDIAYSFSAPPTHVVEFTRSGSTLSISAAGTAVTLTTAAGCVIHTATPASVQIPSGSC